MIHIYTDGACRKNPGPGGWGSLIILKDKYYELGGYSPQTTNNIMEMTAAVEALKSVKNQIDQITLYTDSEYLRKGITGWIKNWKRNGWKTKNGGDVKNRELWQELEQLDDARITWKWVKGHADDANNNRVDEIARTYSHNKPVPLRTGSSDEFAPPEKKTGKPQTDSNEPKFDFPKIYSVKKYLSLVRGELQRHNDWESCKMRTHGASGAKFKGHKNYGDELETAKGWGFSEEDLINLIMGIKPEKAVEEKKNEPAVISSEISNISINSLDLSGDPLHVPEDLREWKAIHLETFLRPFFKRIVAGWDYYANNDLMTICPKGKEDKFEIILKDRYAWQSLPPETLWNDIRQGALKSSVFPDRFIAAVTKTNEGEMSTVLFPMEKEIQNLSSQFPWREKLKSFGDAPKKEITDFIRQVEKKTTNFSYKKWGKRKAVKETPIKWILETIDNYYPVVVHPRRKIPLEIIINPYDSYAKFSDMVVKESRYLMMLRKPWNSQEESLLDFACFLSELL